MEFYSPQPGAAPVFTARPQTMAQTQTRRRLNPVKLAVWALVLVVFVLVPAITGLWYVQGVYYPATPSGAEVQLKIDQGMSVNQISQMLVDKGLLAHPNLLKAYLKISGHSSAIQAGDFTVKQDISVKDLVAALGVASRDQATLRFPEGWRREEMADYINQQHTSAAIKMTGDDFSALALTPSVAMKAKLGASLPADTSLQGFLFPDTYKIDTDETADSLISRMLDNYKAKVTTQVVSELQAQQLTEYQGLILASIVEREARSGAERPIIAGILLKRLQQGISLGTDATVQYALGYSETENRWWRQNLNTQDLAIDSPYNTRLHTGLPPHPICNPGIEAIMAVAQPTATPYLYYMHDSHGQVHYAKTLEEHNANVAKYL